MKNKEEILRYFPNNIRKEIEKNTNFEEEERNQVQEIRIRVSKPIILRKKNDDVVLDCKINKEQIMYIVEKLCNSSLYAYKNQICEGFITCFGGHRVGIVGSAVLENGNVINIKNISCLNFRIAREVIDCSEGIIDEILEIENNTIKNTVIVSEPGKGKTTMLRDIVRKISNGMKEKNFKGITCGVVDERGEIAAMYQGIPQNDVGIRTDVIENISKEKGIEILIRSMSPKVIVCDEIGNKSDLVAIEKALISGVKGLFTMHGKNMEDVRNNKIVNEMIESKKIEKIIFL